MTTLDRHTASRIDHLLDAQAIAARLHEALPGSAGTRLAGARLHQSRRRISNQTERDGAPFLDLAYALDMADDRGRTSTRWCSLQACTQGRSAELSRAGGIHLADLDVVLRPLEDDPALHQAAAFIDAAQVHAAVARWCDAPVDVDGPVAQAQVVRYEPRTHLIARATLLQAARTRVVWGKAYAGDTWCTVAQRLIALWPYGQQNTEAFAVARPAGASAALRAVWQDEVTAAPARDQLRGDGGSGLMGRVAAALGHLQSMPPLGTVRLAPAELLARADKQADKLERAEAALAVPLRALRAQLAEHPAPAPLCNVHGDFHIDQLRVGDGRVWLFDLDGLAMGHAAHDIADFASQLLTDATMPAAARSRLARGFVHDAVAASARGVPAADLEWHLRVLLLRKAYSFFVRHRHGWLPRVQQALDLAALGLRALQADALEVAA